MTHQEFIELILEPRISDTISTLKSKGEEYSDHNEVFHHFFAGARLDDITPERCLWDYMRKHLISLQDIVNDPASADPLLFKEKIGDVICYLILLEGILIDLNSHNVALKTKIE